MGTWIKVTYKEIQGTNTYEGSIYFTSKEKYNQFKKDCKQIDKLQEKELKKYLYECI